MIRLNDYIATIANEYGQFEEAYTKYLEKGEKFVYTSVLSQLNKAFDAKLAEEQYRLETLLMKNPLKDLDTILNTIYVELQKIYVWEEEMTFKYIVETLLEKHYEDGESLSEANFDDFINHLEKCKNFLVNNDIYKFLENLITNYREKENMYVRLFNRGAVSSIVKMKKEEVADEIMNIEGGRVDIEEIKEMSGTEIDKLFEEKREAIEGVIGEKLDLTQTVIKLVKDEAVFNEFEEVDVLISRTAVFYFKQCDLEVLTVKPDISILQPFINLMYLENERMKKEPKPETRKKAELEPVINTEQFGETVRSITIPEAKAEDDDVPSAPEEDTIPQSTRTAIIRNLRRIYLEYCKAQLARTAVKATFSDYYENITSLKLAEFLDFSKKFNIFILKDEKRNKLELTALFKIMANNYGVSFKAFKSILKHITVKESGGDKEELTEKAKDEMFFQYLINKGFDDTEKSKAIKVNQKGFINTLDRSNMLEYRERRFNKFVKSEALPKLKNRKRLEKRIIKKTENLKNSIYFLNYLQHSKLKKKKNVTFGKENKNEKLNKSVKKNNQAKLPYKKIDSYYERAQIKKQRNLINNIEWNELSHMKPDELNKVYGANPHEVMSNLPDL